MDFVSFLRFLCPVLNTLTCVCFFYQMVYLFLPLLRKDRPFTQIQLHRYAILIAAHNEEKVLPHLLASIGMQDYPEDLITVYVVADNCTDATAKAAHDHGAKVFRRNNKTQIGKGYALRYLFRQIDATDGLDSFDCFLIFDADNLLRYDYITQINQAASDGYEAFCGYRNSKNFGSNWLSAGYALWYLHESTHLNRSRMNIGMTCAVSGTGFGFTRQLLERMGGWNFCTLTEDLEFNAWCATGGIKIGYCHDAVLYDEQPITFSQSWHQRTRWTQGVIQVSLKYAGAYLRGIFKGGWVSYASFEAATLSLWGLALAACSSITSLLLAFLSLGLPGLLGKLMAALGFSYISLLLMGALTLMTEWKRIQATKRQKILSVFCFPVFMLTAVPIALAAPFQRFRWTPTAHTVAVTVNSFRQQ